jgi:hypothetical protein
MGWGNVFLAHRSESCRVGLSMRTNFILSILTMCLAMACGSSEPKAFILRGNDVSHIDGCHVQMFNTNVEAKLPFVALKYVCGASESALSEKEWKGDSPAPLGFSMHAGDCLLLDQTFYCVDTIKLGEVSFSANYKWATKQHDHLERIR